MLVYQRVCDGIHYGKLSSHSNDVEFMINELCSKKKCDFIPIQWYPMVSGECSNYLISINYMGDG